ncbi:hypothetical protein L228DRAFT_247171 [Xylona heveae TC161]|uniref:C4-dicarboxylate transporter/malic acid transport protein n=1 Tax=Xylona heveae (strain CBS 132557 / TC161) TaxID=1328760 RepID=A0A165GZ84_XYLHT|nr:hypothetical protein L228DRAFT_247171 [Xylona heveae TC161]KZF22786.1 hypothetical protein L228DRAFT_247171 [Xylona heveae TC161]
MATGGVANVLYTVSLRFPGLFAIGCIFFIFNLCLFLINCCMIITRFVLHPGCLRASLVHPTESLFVPAIIVSVGLILLNISQYGLLNVGHWLNTTVMIIFWIYAGIALLFSVGIYLEIWSTQTFTINEMTPIWIFPAYPLLVIGPHAGTLATKLSSQRALSILIGGWTLQGIGFMVSLTINAAFIYRLMTQKLPRGNLRPGMFVSVGPAGFTATGIISMSSAAGRTLPENFLGDLSVTAPILHVVGSFAGIWLWGLSLWFFFVSVGAHWSCVGPGKLDFTLTWYSFVFPNTALITATFAVAEAFDAYGLEIVGCIFTIALVIAWFFVFAMMIRAIYLRQILWPQKGDDRDEGGWKGQDILSPSDNNGVRRRQADEEAIDPETGN